MFLIQLRLNVLSKITGNTQRKKDLENLYRLSDNVHTHKICAPDQETLKNMIEDLDKKGFLYKTGEVKASIQNQKIKHHNYYLI